MRHDQYRFRFYLNASHGIYLSGNMGEVHPHTWEIILTVLKASEEFAPFHEIEKKCEQFLFRFQDTLINDIPPFTTVNPTLENIAAYFKGEMQKMLQANGWILTSIELSETPARAYIISTIDEVTGGGAFFDGAGEETIQGVIDKIIEKKIDPNSNIKEPEHNEEWEKSLAEAHKKITSKKTFPFAGAFKRNSAKKEDH
ncbi:hypothetical protein MASR2M70_00010 [Bacillota bacterium]